MRNAFFTVLFLATNTAWAAVQTAASKGGLVEMLAIGKPSFIKIQGKGDSPAGEIQIENSKVSGHFEFDLKTLDTGIELRNDHMKNKYLSVDKHPKARLKISPIALTPEWSWKSPSLSEREFAGDLTLHGETRPAKGRFSIDDKGRVMAKLKIKLSDYKVDIPSYMGITVADEVEVTVQIDEFKVKP